VLLDAADPQVGPVPVRPARSAGPDDAPDVWPSTARVQDGALHIGGVSIPHLARACGTPLYVLDEADVRRRARQWHAAADRVHYAGKAFLSTEFVGWIRDEGLHLDVCSGGELSLAIAAGMPAHRIAMHGNNKSIDELRAAVHSGVGVVVVDCTEEIERLAQLAAATNRVQDIYVRVTPGIVADTHAYMATGGDDVKFGFPIAGGYAAAAVRRVLGLPALRLRGVHSHLGSQILDLSGLREGAHRVGALLADIERAHGLRIGEVDLGGGAGIAYLAGQRRLEPDRFVAALRDGLRTSWPHPVTLAVEPGRAIVGTAGVTVYEVGVVKDRALRRFVSVDGGMSDALRPSLYGADYTAFVASRAADGDPVLTSVVGKHCETGDVVVPSVALPDDIAPGDLLAVPATGAYHAAMASNYNLLPRPAVVAVADGRAKLLVRRETPADVLARDGGGAPIDLAAAARRVGPSSTTSP
jgi:diaminopimelate decarboxylase